MQFPNHRFRRVDPRRRGAALLLSLLILLVLVAIVIQINVSTGTDARVARNDIGLTTMDLAVESALLQEYDKLKTDGEAASAGAGGAAGGQPPAQTPSAGGAGAGAGGAAGQNQQASDSRRDEWAQVQRTDINEIKLRILVQDEDSKLNVLTLVSPDEKEAQAAYDRIVRCLDMCRQGTEGDITTRAAEDMTRAMLEYMQRRNLSKVPKPKLLSDNEQNGDQGLPMSLEEFAVLPQFDESLFRDYRDSDGRVVHSIGSFLTVWSGLTTQRLEQSAPSSGGPGAAGGAANGGSQSGAGANGAQNGGGSAQQQQGGEPNGSGDGGTHGGAQGGGSGNGNAGSAGGATNGAGGAAGLGGGIGGQGATNNGWAVNVNTAPVAVLKALFDDREVRPRFWDKVIEYRNLEEEKQENDNQHEDEEATPVYDEFGNEVVERRIFESLAELQQVDGFDDLEAALQQKVRSLLTTQSQVFSIYIVARRTTSGEGDSGIAFGARDANRIEEEQGDALVRVVRSVVWRRKVDEDVQIIPILRWEYLDYLPFEVLDYPDDER